MNERPRRGRLFVLDKPIIQDIQCRDKPGKILNCNFLTYFTRSRGREKAKLTDWIRKTEKICRILQKNEKMKDGRRGAAKNGLDFSRKNRYNGHVF